MTQPERSIASRFVDLPRRSAVLVIGILVTYSAYGLAFIYRTSFVIGGQRYFSLLDDAMISMRYARNLAEGYGLVWNPGGPRVEGFTNPIWVLFMAGLHLLPVGEPEISLLVQLTGLVILMANVVMIARITDRLSGGSALAVAAAALLTASYLSLNNWGLQGMEVSLCALIISLGFWLAMQSLEANRVPRLLYVVLGLGILVRLDMIVPFAVITGSMVVFDRAKRRQHLVLSGATFVLTVGGQTACRLWYYGDIVPNTYYLKMTGYPVSDRLARGGIVLIQAAIRLVLGLLLLLPALSAVPRSRPITLLVALIAGQAAYSVYVGGDAWEWAGGTNRYIVVVVPLMFILLAIGVGQIARAWAQRGRFVLPALVLASVVTLNAATAANGWRVWTLQDTALDVPRNANNVRTALFVRAATTPQARVAVVWAGAEPYFMHRIAIDMLGKCDSRISHELMRRPPAGATAFERFQFFWPGHLKFNYAYSLGQLRPDVITELWFRREEFEPFVSAEYVPVAVGAETLFVRRDSPNIKWGRVRPLIATISATSRP